MKQELNRPMTIMLRDAGPDDEPFLFEVYACTRAAELAQVPWPDEQRDAFLRMQFQAQHSHYHEQYPDADYKVILREGEPVGRLYVLRERDLIRMMDITVLPEYRNSGIGSELIRGVLNEAAESGRNVQIYVETFNPSLALFKKMGFSILQEEGINYLLEWNVARAATEAT
jgi:ribosomal protein S18 acetylase RimI-like enzyme